MIVYLLFKVDWADSGNSFRDLVDVFKEFKDAEKIREEMQEEYGFYYGSYGTDFEIEEREVK